MTEARSNPSLASRVRGGIWGLLVGDALGVPYEFHRPEALPELITMTPPAHFERAHRHVPPGTYSDDGAQALCLLASLIEHEALDVDDFARRLVNWYEHGYLAVNGDVFDVGVQTQMALRALMLGTPPLEAGPNEERRNGNGSLMRVLPLALFHRGSDAELVQAAEDQSRVTHGHAQSRVACAAYCLWARELLVATGEATGDSEVAWTRAVAALRGIYVEGSEEREVLERVFLPDAPVVGFGSGYVVDTLLSARMLLARHASFEEVVVAAVRLGDDTDTTAAVAGGLAAVREGVASIPSAWLEALRGKAAVEPLVEWLVRLRVG